MKHASGPGNTQARPEAKTPAQAAPQRKPGTPPPQWSYYRRRLRDPADVKRYLSELLNLAHAGLLEGMGIGPITALVNTLLRAMELDYQRATLETELKTMREELAELQKVVRVMDARGHIRAL